MAGKDTVDMLLSQLKENLPGGILIYRDDADGEILYANPWLIHVFGCSSFEDFMETTGGTFSSLVHPDDRDRVDKDIREQIAGSSEKLNFVNYRIIRKDGSVRRVEEFGHRVFIPSVGALFYVFFLDNDTKYKIYDIDSLTGLPGKTRFMQHAAMTLAMAALDPQAPKLVFLYVNIHNFNFYNLRNGSEKGNQFLIKMAEVLRRHFPNSLVSRFTDDHFVVLSSRPSVEAMIPAITGEIHALYDASRMDVKFGIYEVEDFHVPVESACGMAQMACDSIKELPDQHICFYTDAMSQRKALRSYIIDHFREALEKHWIEVYFQPVIRTISGTLSSVEALSRWNDPDRGMISPGVFIPLLEDSRQIKKLDLYVLEEICRRYRFQIDHGKTVIPASFNLSRIDFFQESIYEDVEEIRNRYQVPRNMLYVEVTESAFVHEGDMVRKEIDRFRAAGYEVWMDDFGSGYSSLNTLKDYCFDEIKIDMAFLSNFTEKSRDIIKAIVRMAKEIGMHTLVEGVETEEQMQFVRSIGCELIQGYYYGKPMPFSEFKHARREKGWEVETPQLRRYYSSIGSVDFLTDKAMAVVEFTRNHLHYLFANPEFLRTLRSAGMDDLSRAESFINAAASPVSKNIRSFLEDLVRSQADRSITYTENGQYMKMDARYMAHDGVHHLAVLYLNNITIQDRGANGKALDWVTRNIFYLYQHVGLIDPAHDSAIPLVMNSPYRQFFPARRTGIPDMVKEYAESMVHPDDRKRFMEFNDIESIMERAKKDPFGTIVGCFRTLGNDGRYHWDVHSILPVRRKGKIYLLYTVRNSPLDEKEFRNPLLTLLNQLPDDT
ncbi:EAL domain-containing protein [Dialister sp.]|uniref:EAL domain-containing protein n=1 Tax=Dialister sp. TaxID=1955814 RepID=UPI003F07F860